MRGVVVELAAQRFEIPYECPCCGATPPDGELSIGGAAEGRQGGGSLLFPYCKRCTQHAREWESSGVASAGVMVLGIIAAVVLGMSLGALFGVPAFIGAASLAWWLRNKQRASAAAGRGASCAASGVAVEYRGWTGTTSAFTFESPTFAARFAEQNPSLLVNASPELGKLLDRYKRARLAVPTPAVAAGVAPPPLTEREWLARVESTEGTVARRVQLQRALAMVDEPRPRRELIQAVAGIELAPLLAKLQRLTSPAAKRALLESSMQSIRADNIPEELAAYELQQLQARLAELG